MFSKNIQEKKKILTNLKEQREVLGAKSRKIFKLKIQKEIADILKPCVMQVQTAAPKVTLCKIPLSLRSLIVE